MFPRIVRARRPAVGPAARRLSPADRRGTRLQRAGGGSDADQSLHERADRPGAAQTEAGTAATDICRRLEITETTFYRWKRKFGDLGVTEVRELKQLREENRKLKTLVAELSLDKTILREALKRKW